MDVRTYLAIEVALTRKLVKEWQKHAHPVYEKIAKAINDEDWHLATDLVGHLDLHDIAYANKHYIEDMLYSASLYGAARCNKHALKGAPPVWYEKHAKRVVEHTANNFCQYLEHSATSMVQGKMLQSIADAERAAKDKKLELVTKDDLGAGDLAVAGKLNPEIAGKKKKSKLKKISKSGEIPLYMSRPVLNAAEIVAWAKDAGFKTTLLPEDMHITVVFSKTPLDPDVCGTNTDSPKIVGGKREIAQFNKGAVVLQVQSIALQKRWQEFRDAGASWDWDEYKPHITITYDAGEVDVSKVEPFEGDIELGPEHFEEIDTDKAKVEKADDSGRYVTDFVSFDDGGDAALQMASSLNSSRMATWGFTAEAEVKGITRYRLTAVLDGRTSRFCQMIDGREFDVSTASDLVNEALSAQDPEALKQIQPWPDQSREAIAEYEGMSDEELVAAGLNIPPFHPNCRTMLTAVEGDGGEAAPPLSNENAGEPASADDFEGITDAELQHYNDYVGGNPGEVSSDLTGAPADDSTVSVSPDGTINFDTSTTVGSGPADIQQVLDPYTGKLYLSQLDFQSADTADQAAFVAGLLDRMITKASDLGADKVVVGAGADAYSFAKMGFVPDAYDWQTIRLDAMDALQGGELETVLKAMTDEEQATVLNLLSDSDEAALTKLVDLPIEVEGKSIGEWILDGVEANFELDVANEEAVSKAMEYLNG